MSQQEVILFIVKLVFGGIAAFLAVMLWSKTKDIAWMGIVAGTVASYAGIVYDMMVSLSIILPWGITVFEIPITALIFTVLPSIFFIAAFIIMLYRSR